jgi:hypothetical protein
LRCPPSCAIPSVWREDWSRPGSPENSCGSDWRPVRYARGAVACPASR